MRKSLCVLLLLLCVHLPHLSIKKMCYDSTFLKSIFILGKYLIFPNKFFCCFIPETLVILILHQMANMMTDSADEQPNYLVGKMSQLNFMSGGRRFVDIE